MGVAVFAISLRMPAPEHNMAALYFRVIQGLLLAVGSKSRAGGEEASEFFR